MLKRIFRSFGLKTAQKELKHYLSAAEKCSDYQLGEVFAWAMLVYDDLVESAPLVGKILVEKDDLYGEDLASLILATNNLLKKHDNSSWLSGVKFWNETFRCLAYPELTEYGSKIWRLFRKNRKGADNYLDVLLRYSVKNKNEKSIKNLKRAKKYLLLTPKRFK